VWKYTEVEDIAAQPMLMISDRFGGSVLMAVDSSGRQIGFSFAMPGWMLDKRLFWWSHMTAVLPEYQNREIGLALKLRQRQEALASGIDLIKWTFDPMQSLNAHFNLCKLGVIVYEYEENIYGYTSSPLHQGLPTDRFVAEWDLDADRVRQRVQSAERFVILRDLDRLPRINADGNPPNLKLEDGPLLLEIPTDLDELRKSDPEKAKQWQIVVRTACLHYFKAGFAVTDFIRLREPQPQALYVLELKDRMSI
jgi:predicted GNAT superfamily acetyltransferase